jgi:hypothetical protein
LQKGISVAIVGGVIILFSVNLFSDFLPNSRPDSNLWPQISDTLGEQTNPDDLFISLGNHPLDFHLPYFARRRTLSYDLIYLTSGSNSAVADEAIRNVIRATLEQGGRIFVHDCNKGDITNRKHLFEHLSSVDSEPGVLERWNFDQKVIICEITMP